MTDYVTGDTVELEIRFYDENGDLIDPDFEDSLYQVTLEIYDAATKERIVEETDIGGSRIEKGVYFFFWETTEDLREGQYIVDVTAKSYGLNVKKRCFIELIDVGCEC